VRSWEATLDAVACSLKHKARTDSSRDCGARVSSPHYSHGMHKSRARRAIQNELNGATRSTFSPSRPSLSSPGKASPRSGRARGSDAAAEELKQLAKNVQPLEVDTLRPLVDLAYWSTFLEVRRDCAAAFATLSMNEANLDVLSQAGALGALLALIGVGSNRNDSQVHRNAGTALSYLVKLDDIKYRLLKSPNGLQALFYLTRSPNVSVKRAAVKTLFNLASLDEAKEVIVVSGGIKSLLKLAEVKDERTKRQAVRVIRRCAELQKNRTRMMAPAILEKIIHLLGECPDLVMRRDLVETLNLVALVEDNAEVLINMGALLPLLEQTDLTISSIDTVLQCVRSVFLLVSNSPSNILTVVHQGTIGKLVRCVFEDLPRFYSHRPRQGSVGGGATHGAGGVPHSPIVEISEHSELREFDPTPRRKSTAARKQPVPHATTVHGHAPPEVELMRVALSIFAEIANQRKTRDTLVEWGVLDYLLQETIAFSADKKTRRTASRIVKLLAENGGESCVRHQDMVAKGGLSVLAQYLRGEDYELRCDAAAALSHMSVSDELKIPICQAQLLPDLLTLVQLNDQALIMHVARTVAELSDVPENEETLFDAGVLEVLVKLIAPSMHQSEARLEAVRAMSSLSSNENAKKEIVGNAALGHLISLSKSGKGLEKMYALATLTNLAHDTAALRIQMAFRGFVARKNTKKKMIKQAAKK
jgi:hypothetical protein